MAYAKVPGADDWMGTDSIAFRRVAGGTAERVMVTVKRVTLSELWRRAHQPPADPVRTADVGPELEGCSPYGDLPAGSGAGVIPDGYVPVLTCTCGTFSCGGALARITFDRTTVQWGDFTTAAHRAPVDVGPFRLRRTAYEADLRSF